MIDRRFSAHARLVALTLAATCAIAPRPQAAVTMPAGGTSLLVGDTIQVTWDTFSECSLVDIELYAGRDYIDTIADDIPNGGRYEWTVSDLGMGAACNLSLRIGCATGSVRSGRFAIDGLLLTIAEVGSRTVDLEWRRDPADTLGATRVSIPDPGDRAFGGYNVWRAAYDNQLDPKLRGFRKIRTYDVTRPLDEESSKSWDFDIGSIGFGPIVVGQDEFTGEDIIETFSLAQTLTMPAGGDVELHRVRLFLGPAESIWVTELDIVEAPGGVPNVEAVIGSTTRRFGSGGATSGIAWASWEFPDSLPRPILTAGSEIAMVLRGTPQLVGQQASVSWASAFFDAVPGGQRLLTTDETEWSVPDDVEGDFAFVMVGSDTPGGTARVLLQQRKGGVESRSFNDPESIRALTLGETEDDLGGGEDEQPPVIVLDAPGPYNGFELRYAVTTFSRYRNRSRNVEFPSACEDTVFVDGVPDRVVPNTAAVWPETLYARSQAANRTSLLADVYPVPNPYVRDVDSASFPRWELPGQRKIQFVNLPTEATIKIYTLAGDFVRRLEHAEVHGTHDWNLRNESGEIVVSGVYLWLVEAPTGERKTGQLVIVR